MQIIQNFVSGLFSVLKITGAPLLYRYPYRNSAEGLRSDWSHIGQDIESVIGRLEEVHDGRTEKR
jgi:hypothetical protein